VTMVYSKIGERTWFWSESVPATHCTGNSTPCTNIEVLRGCVTYSSSVFFVWKTRINIYFFLCPRFKLVKLSLC
jgi:hypothetical protein